MYKNIPNKLKKGDTIGIVAPSGIITKENIEELKKAEEIVKKSGFQIKYSKNFYSTTNIYTNTAKEKAEDINEMFKDTEIKMIWCAKGGENSNICLEYLDYELIKNNSKIFCGYSDITSLSNSIYEKTGLVTFSGTNFKTIATDETSFSYEEIINRFCKCSLELKLDRNKNEKYKTIKEGKVVEGELIGGNLSLIKNSAVGKYSVDFKDKILFIEELGFETSPTLVSSYLGFMRQNDVFKKVKGIWVGNYEHPSNITLEDILLDILDNDYDIPIIKSNNFGHIEAKTVIPIGTKARIDITKDIKIELIEKCIKK